MPSAAECARHIKSCFRTLLTDTHSLDMNALDWFRPSSTGRLIPLKDITRHADAEYERFRRIDSGLIQHSFDGTQKLREWIEASSEEALAYMIGFTPFDVKASKTAPAFEFTPFQRLSMMVYVTNPFPITSKIMVDTESLRAIAYSPQDTSAKRKQPIQTQFSVQKGESPDFGIIDLPTGSGKTAWVISVLFLLMSPDLYPKMCRSYRRKMLGQVYEGDLLMLVANLSIIAVGPTVFGHFVDTLNRLLPSFQALLPPGYVINVWTKMSKYYSIKVAADAPDNVITFWVMPPDKINQVRREHPTIALVGCVVDEFTQDKKPTMRSRTDVSTVLKNLVTQATPQRLREATERRSHLQEFFGGQLFHSANDLTLCIKARNFAGAYTVAKQICQLDVITLTAFRNAVRTDLCNLLPPSLQVEFIQARRETLASHMVRSRTDAGPISMASAICSIIQTREFRVDSVLRDKISQVFQVPIFSMTDMFEELLELTDSRDRNIPSEAILRLKERHAEFSTEGCPICAIEAPLEDLRFCGSCGYAMCHRCVHRCQSCPFCRKTMRYAAPQTVLATTLSVDQGYPTSLPFPESPTIKETLAQISGAHLKQITATTLTIHAVLRAGYKRLLIMVENTAWHRGGYNPISPQKLQAACGLQIFDADMFLRGKGTEFNDDKKLFDRNDSTPRAFMCFSNPEFMVGTDLCTTDCIITSGTVENKMLTQAIGRAIRPNSNRDITKPLLMVTVYV